jgi:hypothetical protein
MGFLGGIFKSLFNPLSLFKLAMGPAGWASLVMKTIGSQLAMNVIQRLGQQMGLPQSATNFALSTFANTSGQPGLLQQPMSQVVRNVVDQLNLTPSQAGQLQRDLQNISDQSSDSLTRVLGGINKSNAGGAEEASEGNESFLVAIAKALGKVMDKKAMDMKLITDDISKMTSDTRPGYLNGVNGNNKDNASALNAESTKISSKTSLLQAYGQELSVISNAATNVVKTIGEANVTNVRKG